MAFKFLNTLGFGRLSEDDLLKRYRSTKDQKWIAALFARYADLIYGVCLRYTPEASEAEDMTMEIYQKVADKALSHTIRRFKSWVYVVSKNHCLEQIRKLTGRKTASFDPDFVQFRSDFHLDDEYDSQSSVESQFEVMEQCIELLNMQQKKSIKEFYYNNRSYVEIAALIEDEVSHVRSYLQNGRRNLKKCVERGLKR